MAGLEVGYSERAPVASPDEVDDSSLGGLETFGDAGLGGDLADDLGGALDQDAGVAATPEDAEPLPLMEDEGEPLPMLDMDAPVEPLPGLPEAAETKSAQDRTIQAGQKSPQ